MNGMANHLWQSTLFAVAAAGVAYLLHGYSARARYWAWLAASMKFLIPFSWLVFAGAQVEAPASISIPSITEVAAPIAPIIEPAASERTVDLPLLVFVVWLAGSSMLALRWARGWNAIRVAARAGRTVPMDLPVRVVQTSASIEPGVFGIWRPVLLLPERLALTDEQLQAILVHEMCHLQYRDNLTAALQMAVESAFWFHPLVWWIGRKMIQERERACDEAVMASGTAPEDYARGILTVCRCCIESPLPCAAGVTGSDLKLRIEDIMKSKIAKKLGVPATVALTAVALVTVAIPLFIGSAARAQVEKFEVASIRPGNPEIRRVGIEFTRGGGVQAENVTLRFLVMNAYGLQAFQVTGGSGWMDSERFHVIAKAPEGQVPASEAEDRRRARLRLQQLLAERFRLQIRRESKDTQGYVLALAKSGSKLKVSSAPASQGIQQTGLGEIEGVGVAMNLLTNMISRSLGRNVVDETGLTGRYDFTLQWAQGPAAVEPGLAKPGAGAAAGETSGPSIFVALQEQLGLRLDPRKVPSESVAIISAERPTKN